MRRYVRALAQTIRLALRGELMEPSPLEGWLAQAADHVEAIHQAATYHGITPAQVTLTIDRRQISMKTIVDAVQFHITQEYPHLYRRFRAESLNVIRASNMDDHFRLTRLAGAPQIVGTPVEAALVRLADHLENMPADA